MIFLGVDPALSSTGFAIAEFDRETREIQIVNLILVETAKSNHKWVRKNSDDIDRCRLISEKFAELCRDADLVFAEVPVGSQSARAMASYGMMVGILSHCEKPLIQVTPSEVKMAAVGSKTASKKEMIEWASAKHPGDFWIRSKSQSLLNKNEHLADAVASIEAGIQTDDFKSILNMVKRLNSGS